MDKDEKTDAIDVYCPVCRARLVVDADTGSVLDVEHKSIKSKDFDSLLGDVMTEGSRRDERFKRAFGAERKRKDTLAKKFERAKKQAESEDDDGGSRPSS